MGDPISYQGKHVGYISCVNMGKQNHGFSIRFDSLEILVRILSLPDSEILHIGGMASEDEVSVGKFKKEYMEDNCVALYFSSEQESRDRGAGLTKCGKENANEALQKAGFPPLIR
jgi:hypothetical protein